MTGVEKAACLLLTLTPQLAEGVLAQFERDDSDRLRRQMEKMRGAPQTEKAIDSVLEELDELVQKAASLAPAPEREPAEETPALTTASPPAESPRSVNAPAAETNPAGDSFAALRLLSVDRLAPSLEDEHPRTVALVLSQLEPVKAGEVLKRLPPPVRRDISLYLSQNVTVGPDVLQRIAQSLLSKSLAAGERPTVTEGSRYKKIAEMLRQLERADRLEVLAALEEKDANSAAAVKEYLYQIEDLLQIEDRSLQKLLSEVNSKTLGMVLKGAPDPIKAKIMNNLSKRAREMLVEEMEFLGTVPPAQVQEAQKQVLEVIQRLDQAGELVMV